MPKILTPPKYLGNNKDFQTIDIIRSHNQKRLGWYISPNDSPHFQTIDTIRSWDPYGTDRIFIAVISGSYIRNGSVWDVLMRFLQKTRAPHGESYFSVPASPPLSLNTIDPLSRGGVGGFSNYCPGLYTRGGVGNYLFVFVVDFLSYVCV